ncbi:hypothetical protein B1748_13630 [Paenibacillus sp. MY03]|uniref:phosphomethylpyrimidine synthase ThiC n=1 Tax=Paenibacillus sp. MY03 TaxID=302980 RepID=UPI000B3C4737|nr:phosphomethylpyrimidine synthase ThiC [Paenibacillus sp. MY03]OUS76296.1 hypothetical protein B1748_13630 [Paenibacillus sp. MY03]
MYSESYSSIDPLVIRFRTKNGWVKAGNGCRVLVMALVGSSSLLDYDTQIRKINALADLEKGPELVGDLSIVSPPDKRKPLWKYLVEETPFIASTLPVYMARDKTERIDPRRLLDVALEHIEGGVGMITIHPTPSREIVNMTSRRLTRWTSRGGGIIIRDLEARGWENENAYMQILNELAEAARKCGTIISLGASFRSANIFDSFDEAQQAEIREQLRLAEMLTKLGVGVVIESPGHARPADINKVAAILKKSGYPIMPLGPIPTDTAVGQDHISSSIGATLMGMAGAAHILAAVTREEHTGGVPTLNSTVEAVQTAKVAAHIIDLHLLTDDHDDYVIAQQRSDNRSCVIGKKGKGCARCGVVCPL